jgi:hypothetical protein
MQEAFGAYRAVVAELSEERKVQAWTEVGDCLKEFEIGGAFETQLEFVICAGARPRS